MAYGLDDIIKDINKKSKYDMITLGGIEDYTDIERIPFSSPRLNYMLYGGIPVGRIVEFYGEEGSGKTTTALDLAEEAQKKYADKKVVYMDCERTFSSYWAHTLGVDVESLVLIQPQQETAEELFDIALSIMDTGEVSLLIIDSLGVMVSQQAYQKTMEEKTYGGISQPLTLFSKKAVPICARTKCVLLGINQVRDDMHSMYGGKTTTGGRGWKHNTTVRLEFRKGDYIDDKGNKVSKSTENPAGNLVQCAVIKSKASRPDRKMGYYTLKYLIGIDYISDLIDVALKISLIVQGGAWFTLVDVDGEIYCDEENKPLKFQGKPNLAEFLKDNETYRNLLTENINQKLNT